MCIGQWGSNHSGSCGSVPVGGGIGWGGGRPGPLDAGQGLRRGLRCWFLGHLRAVVQIFLETIANTIFKLWNFYIPLWMNLMWSPTRCEERGIKFTWRVSARQTNTCLTLSLTFSQRPQGSLVIRQSSRQLNWRFINVFTPVPITIGAMEWKIVY